MKTEQKNTTSLKQVYKKENVKTDVIRDSKDYEKIKLIQIEGLNRTPSRTNVRSLKEKMKKNGFTTSILVVRTKAFNGVYELYIIDGQHRFLAAKELNEEFKSSGGFSFNYDIKELINDTVDNVSELIIDQNDCAHNWQNANYRESGLAHDKLKKVKSGVYEEMTKALQFKSSTGVKLKGEDVMHIFVGGTNKEQISDFRHKKLTFNDKKRKDSLKKLGAITKVFGKKSVLDCVPKSFTRRGVYELMRNDIDKDYERVAKFIVHYSEKLESQGKQLSEGQLPFLADVGEAYRKYVNKIISTKLRKK